MKKKLSLITIFSIGIILIPSSCNKIAKESGEAGIALFAKKGVKKVSEKGADELAEYSSKKTLTSILRKSTVNKFATATKMASKRLFVTERNQFITNRSFKRWLSVPGNNKRLILGAQKNGGVLRENLRMSMGLHFDKYARKNAYEAHHLVATDSRFPSTAISQKILRKFQIDINDPMNGIILPKNGESIFFGAWHSGGHTQSYHNLVEKKLKSAKTREECMEILDLIKKDLYGGKIELYKTHKINNLKSSFQN